MADNKKSFVLYCDLINAIDHLTTLEKGVLFEHLLDYVNDKNPILKDRVLLGTWKHIEQSLKRDLVKYEARAERSRNNGALGGRPKNPEEPKEPSRLNNNPDEPRKPDSVNVTVSDTVTDNVSVNDTDTNNIVVYSEAVHYTFEKCCEYFENHLLPTTTRGFQNWHETIKKLIEIDKIPPEKIVEIVKKTRNDDFWAKNFLSLTKLRKNDKNGVKYITVFNESMKANGKKKGTNILDLYK